MDDEDSDDVSRCTVARGVREVRESISPEIWSARESAWGFGSGRFFSGYVDR